MLKVLMEICFLRIWTNITDHKTLPEQLATPRPRSHHVTISTAFLVLNKKLKEYKQQITELCSLWALSLEGRRLTCKQLNLDMVEYKKCTELSGESPFYLCYTGYA